MVGLSKTFGGALANSELLREYHIRGPLEQDKLQMLREERLAIMMMQDVSKLQVVLILSNCLGGGNTAQVG